MNKLIEYRRNQKICQANATKAHPRELGEMWQTLADTYAFLIELELRPRDALSGPIPEPEG